MAARAERHTLSFDASRSPVPTVAAASAPPPTTHVATRRCGASFVATGRRAAGVGGGTTTGSATSRGAGAMNDLQRTSRAGCRPVAVIRPSSALATGALFALQTSTAARQASSARAPFVLPKSRWATRAARLRSAPAAFAPMVCVAIRPAPAPAAAALPLAPAPSQLSIQTRILSVGCQPAEQLAIARPRALGLAARSVK